MRTTRTRGGFHAQRCASTDSATSFGSGANPAFETILALSAADSLMVSDSTRSLPVAVSLVAESRLRCVLRRSTTVSRERAADVVHLLERPICTPLREHLVRAS